MDILLTFNRPSRTQRKKLDYASSFYQHFKKCKGGDYGVITGSLLRD